MNQHSTVLVSGNLASPRRIIAGLLAQLRALAIGRDTAQTMFTDAGLPARALEEPDFPISLQQELEITAALVSQLAPGTSPIGVLFGALPAMSIDSLGVVGSAMRHAPTPLDALKIPLTYPELTMGHCRMQLTRRAGIAELSFQMDRPEPRGADNALIDSLVSYCVVLDLTSSIRNLEAIASPGQSLVGVTLPYAKPDKWEAIGDALGFPVQFRADKASIAYPAAFYSAPLPHANPLLFRMYTSIADKLSQMLAEEVTLEERVLRWLWTYTPPLGRGEVAELLAMSERNLTRRLGAEGTSFKALLARVQAERAGNLLRNPTLSIAEIGYRLGYAEPAAFSRAFTRWTGQSPMKWRQNSKSRPPLADG